MLFNDDVHTFDYVIKALMDICRHTEEQAEQARKIKAEEAEKAAANLNEKQIQQIAQGRLVKFFKESTLKYQVLAMGGDGKENVGDYIKRMDKDLGCVSFIRRQIGG